MHSYKLALAIALTAGCMDTVDGSTTEDEAALTGYVANRYDCTPGNYELDTRTDGNAMFFDLDGDGSYFVQQSSSGGTTTLLDAYGAGDVIVVANGLLTGAASGALTFKPYPPDGTNLTCYKSKALSLNVVTKGSAVVIGQVGLFWDGNGTGYYASNNTQACGFSTFDAFLSYGASATPGAYSKYASPSAAGVRYTGACPANLPAGFFFTANGTGYYSNGAGHACGYATWGAYLAAGGPPDPLFVPRLNTFPSSAKYDGICH
jgi:hypothetical protein